MHIGTILPKKTRDIALSRRHEEFPLWEIILCTSSVSFQDPPGARHGGRVRLCVIYLRECPMSTIHDLFTKPVLIFGCGNILIGDDGFGPAVVDHLIENFELPPHVAALMSGRASGYAFRPELMSERPSSLLTSIRFSLPPPAGEIFELDVDQIPSIKVNDFSLHQFPSVNLLRELQEGAGVKVRVLAVQVGKIPEEIGSGLSDPVRAAVPVACEWLLREIEETQ